MMIFFMMMDMMVMMISLLKILQYHHHHYHHDQSLIHTTYRWCRPNVIFENPVYFSSTDDDSNKQSAIKQGTLPDQLFLGTLMAIAVYPRVDLIENIFASRPDDFLKYGLYTCRFYVEGEWVEVIADTNIPCVKDNMTGQLYDVY